MSKSVINECEVCSEEVFDIDSEERCWVASVKNRLDLTIGQFNKAEMIEFSNGVPQPYEVLATCFANESMAEKFKEQLMRDWTSSEAYRLFDVIQFEGQTYDLYEERRTSTAETFRRGRKQNMLRREVRKAVRKVVH